MPSFVLELEVSYSGNLLKEHKPGTNLKNLGTKHVLDTKMNVAVAIRNTCKKEALRRLHILQHDREYQALIKEYRACKSDKKSVAEINQKLRAVKKRVKFEEYDLHKYALYSKHQYSDILGADECQKLATQAFKSVEKILYGKSKKVIFLPRTSDSSVEGKSNKSTLKYIGDACIQFGKENQYPLVIKKKDAYAIEALKHPVKYVRLVRRTIRGRQRYFAQLIMDGIPPKAKNLNYGCENSRVGLDEGVSTIAVVSEKKVMLRELAPNTAIDEKKLRKLNRAMERSRRATNPGNYNSDGTVKKGKKVWKKSNRYRKLETKRKELYRRSAWNRHTSHQALANEIVELGLDIRVEEMHISGLARKAKKTTVNKKNGRKRSKKRYGKTVMSRAPAALIAAINQKLSYVGKGIKKINTFTVKASQYDHVSNTCNKKPLNQRWHTLPDGTKIQRDLYSGFLICYTNDELDHVDRKACIRNFKQFKELHDQEIAHLKELDNPGLRWYIA